MALEEITGSYFSHRRGLLNVAEDSDIDLRTALYNSTHFQIPRTFDVGVDNDWLILTVSLKVPPTHRPHHRPIGPMVAGASAWYNFKGCNFSSPMGTGGLISRPVLVVDQSLILALGNLRTCVRAYMRTANG